MLAIVCTGRLSPLTHIIQSTVSLCMPDPEAKSPVCHSSVGLDWGWWEVGVCKVEGERGGWRALRHYVIER
jgi:hypothetical protein